MTESFLDRVLRPHVFRTSPSCELVVVDRLTAEEKRLWGDQLEGLSSYGVLRSKAGGEARAIDRDLALLLFTLQLPGPLPTFLCREMEPKVLLRWIRGLLAAGILELEMDGCFLNSEEALACFEDTQQEPAPMPTEPRLPARLKDISRAALVSASTLPDATSKKRARWLYGYHRQPVTPYWRAKLQTQEQIQEWLGLNGEPGLRLDGLGKRLIERGWASWDFVERPRPGSEPTFKLYVSPRAKDLPVALAGLSEILGPLDAFHLKVGCDLPNILRADKLMLYFATFEAMATAAERLQSRFGDLEPQGVPFTAEIGLEGLLSWGGDPPLSRHWSPEPTRRSWRQWITERLAEAFDEVDSLGGSESFPAWRRVTDLLALEGINTETWSPDPLRWTGLENRQ
ncbi:MAG: hypothetical protein K0U98_14490 [Deltaproteobacteria bacterium]|nr:hypothetical protein [Deltaproteobacteria bacterium]